MPEQVISNFAGGEVSSDLYGRNDSEVYSASARRCLNWFPRAQGPLEYRGGLRFVHPSNQNDVLRLETFHFSDEETYILEFTPGLLRIYEDGNLTLNTSSATITGATQADPVVISSTAHGFSDGDQVRITGVVGMTELNVRFFTVRNPNANDFELEDLFGNTVDGTGFTAYSSGGAATSVFTVASPYTADQLYKFQWAGEGNIGYFVHNDVEPYKLTRVSATSWTFATYVRTLDPFTASTKWPRGVAFYEGRLIMVGTIDNSDNVYASRSPDGAGLSRYDDFTLGAALDDDALIFPISSAHGDISYINWVAGTEPFLALGTTGGISAMDGGGLNEAITPGSVRVRPISPYGAQLLMPVANGSTLFYMQKGSRKLRSFEYEILQDSYRSTDRQFLTNHLTVSGVKQLAFQRGRDDVVYCVTEDGRLLGAVAKAKEDPSGWFRILPGGVDAKVLSVTVESLVSGYDRVWVGVEKTINGVTVRYVEYFTDPYEGLIQEDYFTNEDNEVTDKEDFRNETFEEQRLFTYLDSHLTSNGKDVAGGTITMTPGAATGDGITFTASAAVFTDTATDEGKEIWKKYENRAGGGRATIVSITSPTIAVCDVDEDFDNTDVIPADSWYLTTDTIGGLHHLEGETIQLLADGRTHPDVVVTAGQVTLERQVAVVTFGYIYKGVYSSLFLVLSGNAETSAGRKQNIVRANILFFQSFYTKYGPDLYNLDTIKTAQIGQLTDRPSQPLTGYQEVTLEDQWEESKQFVLVQDIPMPAKVNAVVLDLEIGEE